MLLHETTEDLVDAFSAALRAKLMRAQLKYYAEDPVKWLNRGDGVWMAQQLRDHVAKGDPLDVAAFAAFCWFHGVRTDA